MVILNVDHRDIVEFIDCKMKEERKAQVLVQQGYDPGIDGEAYGSIFYQNANHSVRVTDEYMQAVEEDRGREVPEAKLPRRAEAEKEDGAAAHGLRILSSYTTSAGDRIRLITEVDRSATTFPAPGRILTSEALQGGLLRRAQTETAGRRSRSPVRCTRRAVPRLAQDGRTADHNRTKGEHIELVLTPGNVSDEFGGQ